MASRIIAESLAHPSLNYEESLDLFYSLRKPQTTNEDTTGESISNLMLFP